MVELQSTTKVCGPYVVTLLHQMTHINSTDIWQEHVVENKRLERHDMSYWEYPGYATNILYAGGIGFKHA